MVKLNFGARGYAFEAGLNVLREGYISASTALAANVERVKAEAVTYEGAVRRKQRFPCQNQTGSSA